LTPVTVATVHQIRDTFGVDHGIPLVFQFSGFISAGLVRVSQRHLVASDSVAGDKKAIATILNVPIKQITDTAIGHDLGDVFLVVRTVRRFVYTKLWTSFGVGPRNDPVEPLFTTVDPQDLCPFGQTPTVVNTAAETNLFNWFSGVRPGFMFFAYSEYVSCKCSHVAMHVC
jgi:hypothetical protein